MANNPSLGGSFRDIYDTSEGKRPVVFDILSPDLETSILPDYLKLVLHVNPNSMKFSYQNIIERTQTMGGYVEQHFGSGVDTISIDSSSGGFMRLYTGLTSVTGGGDNVGGTRRETLAYDTLLDILALFHNNGAVYDSKNNIILHGVIKISFDGDYWLGWFDNFSVNEDSSKPFMLTFNMNFTVSKEYMGIKSMMVHETGFSSPLGIHGEFDDDDIEYGLPDAAIGDINTDNDGPNNTTQGIILEEE